MAVLPPAWVAVPAVFLLVLLLVAAARPRRGRTFYALSGAALTSTGALVLWLAWAWADPWEYGDRNRALVILRHMLGVGEGGYLIEVLAALVYIGAGVGFGCKALLRAGAERARSAPDDTQ
jgi:hypothetical protein